MTLVTMGAIYGMIRQGYTRVGEKLLITTVVKVRNCGESKVKTMTITS